MIASADDNVVIYHFLRQVPVITSLSQDVEAGYKLLDSFILLLNATIEFGPLKDHLTEFEYSLCREFGRSDRTLVQTFSSFQHRCTSIFVCFTALHHFLHISAIFCTLIRMEDLIEHTAVRR